MKKILFIHHAAGWGGAPNCMINLINSLDCTKYTAEVLLLKDSIISKKLEEYNINYKVADSFFYKKYYQFFPHSEAGYIKYYQVYSFLKHSVLWFFSRYIYSNRELAKHDFDIVHLNSSVLTDWLAPAKKRGKVIIHIREPFRKGKLDILHYLFKSEIYKYADKIIAISKDNARRIGNSEKLEVIYDFLEIPKTLPSENSYKSKKVLYLGGSSTSKGFYTLIKALDYLDKEIKVYFAGSYIISNSPKNCNIFQKMKFVLSKAKIRNAAIEKINYHSNAKLVGLTYNVDAYLQEVCCLISPFTVPHFSFPVVEAHLKRKPVIGSDVEGMEEIIDNNINGLLFPKNNPIAFAKAINFLTNNHVLAKQYGEEGYKTALKKFTSKNVLQFERLYDEIMND